MNHKNIHNKYSDIIQNTGLGIPIICGVFS
jgi:hypothetical protein